MTSYSDFIEGTMQLYEDAWCAASVHALTATKPQMISVLKLERSGTFTSELCCICTQTLNPKYINNRITLNNVHDIAGRCGGVQAAHEGSIWPPTIGRE